MSKGLSRNQRYEKAKVEQGLSKITIWVPSELVEQFKSIASICCENRSVMPWAIGMKSLKKYWDAKKEQILNWKKNGFN